MNSLPITFEGMGNLYRLFHYAKPDAGLKTTFTKVLTELSAANLEVDTQQKTVRLAAAMRGMAAMARDLQERFSEQDFPCRWIDREVNALQREGITLYQHLKDANPGTFKALTSGIRAVVREKFPVPAEVERTLKQEAVRQQAMLFISRGCGGLAGFYEIVMKRPYLQYDIVNRGVDHKFLLAFPRLVTTIIRSFSETSHEVTRNEGLHSLDILIDQVFVHQDALRNLFERGSDVESFIDKLVLLKENKGAREEFYDQLKRETHVQCVKFSSASAAAGIGREELFAFFDEKAKDIAAALPEELRAPNREVAQHVAGGFAAQQDHGQGAKLSGPPSIVEWQHQWFGGGPNDYQFDTPVDPYSSTSLDTVEKRRVRAAFERIGRENAADFYERGLLISKRYTAMGGAIIPEDVYDPILRAQMTVQSLIHYELAEYPRKTGGLFPLDAAQRVRLAPQMAKKVILSGIQRSVFDSLQIAVLLARYSLLGDEDITGAILGTLQRETVRREPSDPVGQDPTAVSPEESKE